MFTYFELGINLYYLFILFFGVSIILVITIFICTTNYKKLQYRFGIYTIQNLFTLIIYTYYHHYIFSELCRMNGTGKISEMGIEIGRY